MTGQLLLEVVGAVCDGAVMELCWCGDTHKVLQHTVMAGRKLIEAPSLWTPLRNASECVQSSLAAQTGATKVRRVFSSHLGDADFKMKQILSLW